ncbi:hypothetical protein [Vibrio sp. 10N]|uniref:hypothetical protein n=1 Tax=Vibrio sp. 10N TaxID=3058938 RepID=UPI00281380E6|nr:hypothetical protein VB10N_22690 [Vibrio sp. 10N]
MNIKALSILVGLGLMLTGCSQDSDTNESSSSFSTIQGLASAGGGIKGRIALAQVDASPDRTSVLNSMVYTVPKGGEFTIANAGQLVYPTLLKIDGASGVKAISEYTILMDNRSQYLNLNPLTRLLIGKVAGIDAELVFEDFEQHQSKFTATAIEAAQVELKSTLKPLFEAAGVSLNSHLLREHYPADHTKLDAVLSALALEYHSDGAVVTYRPNHKHTLTLTYAQDWQGEQLLPEDYGMEALKLELALLNQASQILEAMILLKDDQAGFEAYLAPEAHWFGANRAELHQNYFNVLPNENDASLERYRDLVLLDSQPEKKRYLVGYTTAFEASTSSSIARDQAWFEFDEGKLKFLGDDKAYPTSFYAVYKLNQAAKPYNWGEFDTFDWVFETSGFLTASDCESVPEVGEWQFGNPAFFDKLAPLSSIIDGLNFVTVISPSDQVIQMDKVYRTPNSTSCHLVDSGNFVSGMLSGYPISEAGSIPSNQTYTVAFHFDDQVLDKQIYLTEPPASQPEMMPYLAKVQQLDGRKDEFVYQWSRPSTFVTEGDLYLYYPQQEGEGSRVTIGEGMTEVSEPQKNDVVRIFHNALDPYGRIINQYYVSADDTPLGTNQ